MLAQHPEMPLLVGRIEQERQRHFEDVGDFDRVRDERKRRLDPADDRRDAIAGHRLVVGEAAEQRHAVARQADFLLGFAQRRGLDIGVVGFDAAAGKADLAGVVGQVGAALRQQDRQPVGAIDQRHEHGGRIAARLRGRAAGIRRRDEVHSSGRGTRQPVDKPLALSVSEVA